MRARHGKLDSRTLKMSELPANKCKAFIRMCELPWKSGAFSAALVARNDPGFSPCGASSVSAINENPR